MSSSENAEAASADLARVCAGIVEGRGIVNPADLSVLSDLDPGGCAQVREAVQSLDETARFAFWHAVLDAAAESALLDYSALLMEGLDDPDGAVRALAASGLADYERDDLLPTLIALARKDPDERVRADAAVSLAPAVLRAEFGQLLPALRDELIGALRALVADAGESEAVQAAALVSVCVIAGSWVPDLIYDALESGRTDLRLAAIQAMGRTADDVWLPTLFTLMTDEDDELRGLAAAAAGEIESEDAVPALAELLTDPLTEVVQAAAAALGEIGGPEAIEQLQEWRTHPQMEVRQTVQAALELAEYADDPLRMPQ